jgi:hypothetical protein
VSNSEESLKNPGPLTKIAVVIAFIMISTMIFLTTHSSNECLDKAAANGMSNSAAVLMCSSGEALERTAQ